MRFDWVDTAKALLIFLVVLGHCHYIYAPVPGKALIYAFHVPAFVFITGFLMPVGLSGIGLRALASKWLATYLRAYALFSAIAILLWWLKDSVRAGAPGDPLPALFGALYGVAGSGNGLVHDNQPLWYFPFLTTSVLAGWACIRLGRWGWAAALAYAGFALFHDGPRLPWALDIAGIGTLAFVCGHALRQHYDRVRPWLEHRGAALGLALAAAAVLVPAVHLNGSANLNGMEYGRNGALYLIAMLAGIGMILGLSAALPVTRLARVISVDTLTIFALHIYLLRVFSKLASTVAPLPASPAAQTAVMLGISALSLAGCLVLARLLRPLLDRVVLRRKPLFPSRLRAG